MENPTVTTRTCPRVRAQATAAARSSTSRSPTVERPPDRPWPRNENVITAARWENTRAARRTAGRSTEPVNPCATTIAGVSATASPGPLPRAPKPAVHGSYTASTGTPSSVSNVAYRWFGVSKGTEELRNGPSDTELMWAILLRRGSGQCSPRVLLCFPGVVTETFQQAQRSQGAGPHRNNRMTHDVRSSAAYSPGSDPGVPLSQGTRRTDVMGERTVHNDRPNQAGGRR
ncbi:hypothetical protein SMICM304S_09731 [Streptomyces microflavus]